MKTLRKWVFIRQHDTHIELSIDEKHSLCLYVLESDLVRVLIKRNNQLSLDRTWSIAPKDDVPLQGRDRLSCEGFSMPSYQLKYDEQRLTVSTDSLRVTVHHQPVWLEWEFFDQHSQHWQPLINDRSTGAYQLDCRDGACAHFQARSDLMRYYGLGEKAGDLNRYGRRYEMRNLDAMGYNAQSTDPLYKHIPFLITQTPQASFGIFYDNLSVSWFDLGNELDNYHQPYRRYWAETGDIDYYMMLGPKIIDVTKKWVRLTGKTCFAPKWSLGYSGSTMHYTDMPDAQAQLQQFIHLCETHKIPCDSFQLSSGYTSIGQKRYVFNWNYHKIPAPEKLTEAFHQAGLKLAANIKPCLLRDHPMYDDVQRQGFFVKESESDNPECAMFWDDEGSYVDFTHPAAIEWWKCNVIEQLLEKGIDSTWNDNNEYEIWDGQARCHGFGNTLEIKYIRPVMALLMMRSSMDAQLAFAPNKRPYLISRSGCPGMQRYVQTWSGDNRTHWNTLKYNIKMGIGMSLSGLYNIGHDVGGFSGMKPEPELFVRWVQNGIMHPRFTIHSWNDDHTVNAPWMYPEVTPIIANTIRLRYRLLPYFYHLQWLAHVDDEPILRPTFLDHEHDQETYCENDDFLLGKDILVASVVEQGQRHRTVYLPDNQHGWYCFYSHQWFSGRQSITLAAPLERLPLLVRAGAIIPMAANLRHADSQHDDHRELHIYPFIDYGESHGIIFDDDGESFLWQQGQGIWLHWQLRCTSDDIYLTLARSGHYQPVWQAININVPCSERRRLWVNNQLINVILVSDLPDHD